MRRMVSSELRAVCKTGMAYAAWRVLWVSLGLLVGGCAASRQGRSTAYFGPTETLAEVAKQVNANDSQISSLWARIGYFEADVRQERGGKSQFVNGSGGYLLMRVGEGFQALAEWKDSQGRFHDMPEDNGPVVMQHSQEIRLRASKAGIGPVIDVGANDENVWLVAPPADRAWWAHRKNIGKPCMEQMPIDPLAIMQVLGVSGIYGDFLKEPAPVMRFNNDRDAYMIIWQSRSSEGTKRWIARREIWYDRRSKLPELVNLFDENGRIVVSAYLSQHKALEGTTAKMATRYQLFFPDSDSHFSFSLTDVKLSSGGFPNDRSFLFSPQHTGVHDVHQMDEACK